MSHYYDTVSRADAEHNASETTILPPSARKRWHKAVSRINSFLLITMLVSGLVCVSALSIAIFETLSGILRFDATPPHIATEWLLIGGISIVTGWAVSLLMLASLFWVDRWQVSAE